MCEGHECRGHTRNTWWIQIVNTNIGIIIPNSGISVFYPIPVQMWSCEMGSMPPLSSFFIVLRITIHYNCSILSLKWVLVSSLNISGKAFQLTMTFITSTSLDSVDSETDCKLDSAMYLVSYFFTHWLVSYSWQQPTLLHSACNFVAISNTVFNPPRCSVEMLSNYFHVQCTYVYFHSVAVLCTHLREPVFNLYQNFSKMKQNSKPQQNHWHMTTALLFKSWCARLLLDPKIYFLNLVIEYNFE